MKFKWNEIGNEFWNNILCVRPLMCSFTKLFMLFMFYTHILAKALCVWQLNKIYVAKYGGKYFQTSFFDVYTYIKLLFTLLLTCLCCAFLDVSSNLLLLQMLYPIWILFENHSSTMWYWGQMSERCQVTVPYSFE